MAKKFLYFFFCTAIVILFLNTGVSKFLDFNNAVIDMNGQPFPNSLSKLLVGSLAVIETAIALCFISNTTRLLALYSAFVLLCVFTLYAVLVLLHAFAEVPCSCGGFMRGLTWPNHLILTGTAAIASLWCIKNNSTVLQQNLNPVNG